MPQMQAEYEYKCRRCGEVFVYTVQILAGEGDINPLSYLSGVVQIGRTGRDGPSLYAIHDCGEDQTGVGDLIGYTIRPQVSKEP
jgi:hypothetical protein